MGFADDLKRVCLKTEGKTKQIVRATALQMLDHLVLLSPVGNPDTWKANAGQAYKRDTHNLFAKALNDAIAADATSYTKSGRLKVPLAREKSGTALRKAFPNVSGKGYVGGRFRANWQVGLGFVNTDTSAPPNAGGSNAVERGENTLANWRPGLAIVITNSLPYSLPLEHGWSKQAPSGMVGLTVQNFDQYVKRAVESEK